MPRIHPDPGSRTIIVFLATFLAGATLVSAVEPVRPILIAHRGEHRRHPENTLSAIQGAIDAGADYVEMDVRRSRDGVHLLMHDATLDRTTDGKGRVADMDWSELSRRTVRTSGSTNGPTDRIPRLEEALKATRGRIRIYLDFKAGDVAQVARMLREEGVADAVVVYDRPERTPVWRENLPGVEFILSAPDKAETDPGVLEAFVKRYRPKALDNAANPGFTAACRKLGVENWPDAQRETEDASWWTDVLATGVTGFQTDHPAEAAEWLRKTGNRTRTPPAGSLTPPGTGR